MTQIPKNGYRTGYDMPTMLVEDFIKASKELPEQDYIIDGILPRGQVMLIAGDPWQGKSLENQRLACSFGTRDDKIRNYHGLKLKKCRSLYITWEGATKGIEERFETLLKRYKPDIPPLIKMRPDRIPLNTSKGFDEMFEYISEMVDRYAIEVVLFDSFPYMIDGNYSKDTVMDAWFEQLNELIYQTGITPIIVYELRKLTNNGNTPEDFFTLERLKGAKGLGYKAYSVIMIGESKKFDNKDRTWKSVGHQIHLVKAKDAKGSFDTLPVKLNRETLCYQGNHWRFDEEERRFIALPV